MKQSLLTPDHSLLSQWMEQSLLTPHHSLLSHKFPYILFWNDELGSWHSDSIGIIIPNNMNGRKMHI